MSDIADHEHVLDEIVLDIALGNNIYAVAATVVHILNNTSIKKVRFVFNDHYMIANKGDSALDVLRAYEVSTSKHRSLKGILDNV